MSESNPPQEEEKKDKYDIFEVGGIIALLRENVNDHGFIQSEFGKRILTLFPQEIRDKYNILFLIDDIYSITHFHSNRIYNAIKAFPEKKDILLVLQSGGGRIEPAYLISKLCKRFAKEKFIVVIPRQAKSAATLIALGGFEIHMGPMSELGPIDPQIGNLPTLSLSNALSSIAGLVEKFPKSAELFASYLNANLSLRHLGYYERLNESAAQYAERLLQEKTYPNDKSTSEIAKHFVYHYKDHGFVIDFDEAEGLLGPEVVKKDTSLYDVANQIYLNCDMFKIFVEIILKKHMRFVGSNDSGLDFSEIKQEEG